MEKKKNKKNDKWEKAKPILLKILHGVSYVFSAIFIGLCVYACASSGSKKENQKPIKQQHNEVLSVGIYYNYQDEEYVYDNTFTTNPLTDIVVSFFEKNPTYIGEVLRVDYSDISLISDYKNDFTLYFSYVEEDGFVSYDISQLISDEYDVYGNFHITNDGVFQYYDYDDQQYLNIDEYEYFYHEINGFNEYYTIISVVEIKCDDIYVADRGIYTYFIGYDNDTLFGGLTNSTSSFIGTLNSGLTDMISIFYDDGITTIGTITLIVVAVSLVWVSFRLISSKVRLR